MKFDYKVITFISSEILTIQLTWKLIEKKRPRRRKPRINKNRSPNHVRTFANKGMIVPRTRGALTKALEKYNSLAQDAFSNGDRIVAESYYQYAEHYQRVLNETVDTKNDMQINKGSLENNGIDSKLSRTERAINAKNERFEKLDNQVQPNQKEQSDPKGNLGSDKKGKKDFTSDGLEALKPFEI